MRNNSALTADIKVCQAMLRDNSRTFFAASLLLPKRVRHAASALYAFCRLADDEVDQVGGSLESVDLLRERLHRAYVGRPLNNAVDRAFAEVVLHYEIPRALPEALLEGFEWDVEGRVYEDISGLYDYAARVAGTVGAMMSVLMGVRSREGVARACELGMAMQLSNIARDVGEDARRGRLYLPRNWLKEAGIKPEHWLAQPVFTPAVGAVVQRVLRKADELYDRVGSGVAELPAGCRPGINAARFLYAEIGREVERAGLDSVSSRAVVSAPRKVLLFARVLASSEVVRAESVLSPIAEAGFLIKAVSDSFVDVTETAAAGIAERQEREIPWWKLNDRLVQLIELFERIERREQKARSAQGSTSDAARFRKADVFGLQ